MNNNYEEKIKHIANLIEESRTLHTQFMNCIKDYCEKVLIENFEEVVNCIQWNWFSQEDGNIFYFRSFKENVPYYIEKLFDYRLFVPNMRIQCSEGITFVGSMQTYLLFDSRERLLNFSKNVDVHIIGDANE